jgi:hypothetical protein
VIGKKAAVRVKILFAAVILWQPMQYIFVSRFGEAYPFLQLPSFRGTLTDDAGNIRFEAVDIKVSFKDGAKSKIKSDALLAQVLSPYRQPIMSHMFGPGGLASAPAGNSRWQRTKTLLFPGFVASRARTTGADVDPETRRWLRNRLLVLFPSKQPTTVTFLWRTDTYHTAASSFAVTHQDTGVREVSLDESR